MKRASENILEIRIGKKKAVASFRNTNRLNILNAEAIRLGLIDIVTNRNSETEVDLTGINFIDSSIIDTLNLLGRMAKRFNSSFFLTHINNELMELIELVKMHTVFDIRIKKEKDESRYAA